MTGHGGPLGMDGYYHDPAAGAGGQALCGIFQASQARKIRYNGVPLPWAAQARIRDDGRGFFT